MIFLLLMIPAPEHYSPLGLSVLRVSLLQLTLSALPFQLFRGGGAGQTATSTAQCASQTNRRSLPSFKNRTEM